MANGLRPLGDLTSSEVDQIQETVNLLKIHLVVVGSAAEGRRRNKDTNYLYGYGANSKSDIDYLIPVLGKEDSDLAWDYVLESIPLNDLPDLGEHPVLATRPDQSRQRIWFRPGKEPKVLLPNKPNLPYPAFELPKN